MRFIRIVSGLACAFVLNENVAQIENYTEYLPDGTNLAMLVQKIGVPASAIDYHGSQMTMPASTMKILTALATLLQLGPDFRFTTILETQGSVSDGVLKGDLVARFSGDPTLKRQNIRNMVAVLKKQGIKEISGDVVVNTSVFASHDMRNGQRKPAKACRTDAKQNTCDWQYGDWQHQRFTDLLKVCKRILKHN